MISFSGTPSRVGLLGTYAYAHAGGAGRDRGSPCIGTLLTASNNGATGINFLLEDVTVRTSI
jgi:hypothetical protein